VAVRCPIEVARRREVARGDRRRGSVELPEAAFEAVYTAVRYDLELDSREPPETVVPALLARIIAHSQAGHVAMVHRGLVWCQDDVQVRGKRSVAAKVPVSYDLVWPVIWQRCRRQLRNKAWSPVSAANEHARPGGYSKTANSLDHLFHPDSKFVQEQVKIERLT
jgi:Chloramphenicol phosphotransferase-like protein